MKTELKIYTVEEICDGFEYNELEGKGLHGLSGQSWRGKAFMDYQVS